jgi:hypothetical protein
MQGSNKQTERQSGAGHSSGVRQPYEAVTRGFAGTSAIDGFGFGVRSGASHRGLSLVLASAVVEGSASPSVDGGDGAGAT